MRATLSPKAVLLLFVVSGLTACGTGRAMVETEPPPPTEADYYGNYAIEFGNSPGAGMTAVWDESGITVFQGESRLLHSGVRLDFARGTVALWAEEDGDITCMAEGLYEFEETGNEMRLSLVSDACAGRRASADGSRLVRLD